MAVDKHDVLVVGAGIVGVFIAYRLARAGYDVLVVERMEEAGRGVTARNAGVIHVVQMPFNSLKSKLCVEGNLLYQELDRELGLGIKWTRAFIASTRAWSALTARIAASVLGRRLPSHTVRVVPGRVVREYEPLASRSIKTAVMVEGYGVVDPVALTQRIAVLVEEQGAGIMYSAPVYDVSLDDEGVVAEAGSSTVRARALVNAAGLDADTVASLYGDTYEIIPVRGVMTIYDSAKPENILAWLRLERKRETKGGGIIPHPRGVLLGPNYAGTAGKDDYRYSEADVRELRNRFQPLLDASLEGDPEVLVGLRPTVASRDFIIEYSGRTRRIVNLVGIESPGLTAAPAIAEVVYSMVSGVLP